MESLKQWMTYANVTATVALFIALGGGAWALSKNSVGSNAIKKDAVRSSEIDNETIKAKDVKPGTLGANQIADGSIGTAEIADGAVGSVDVANNAVIADKLANGAVVNSKLADNAIGSGKIANGAVGASEIANGAVGKPEIANAAVGSAEVEDGTLNGGDIAGNSLTGAQIDESSLGLVPAATNASLFGGRELVSVVGHTDVADELILALPALGAELRTDTSTADDFNIVLKNTGPAIKLFLACPDGTLPGIAVGGSGTGSATGQSTMLCYAWSDPAGAGRTVILCAHDSDGDRILCDILRTP